MTVTPEMLEKLAKDAGGEIKEVTLFPGGHGCAIMELLLPEDHWILTPRTDADLNPPAPLRMGNGPLRKEFANAIRVAGKYALRASIQHPDEVGFDPDALLQNLVVGLLGYWTEDGYSHLD